MKKRHFRWKWRFFAALGREGKKSMKKGVSGHHPVTPSFKKKRMKNEKACLP